MTESANRIFRPVFIQRGIGKPLSESMADEKLLRRIRKGVDALNESRDKHREIRELDLRGADLRWGEAPQGEPIWGHTL